MLSGLAALGRARGRCCVGRPGCAACCDAGLARENYRGAALAFPLGRGAGDRGAGRAGAARLPRRPRRPRPARPRAAALARLRARRRLPRLLDDALGRGEAADAPARLARATRARCSRGRLSTGAIKAIGALALAAYAVSGRGREGSTTSPTSRCCSSRPTSSTCSTCARAGPRRRSPCSRRPLPRRLDLAAARAARDLRRPGRWSAPGSRCASGRCSATPAPTWSARSPGSGC